MQYISQMQTWDMARKITKKSNLLVIDGPTILMKRRRREELWWVEPSEMCVWYCFPFWCFYTICVRSWKFFFSCSCHFWSPFAKNCSETILNSTKGQAAKESSCNDQHHQSHHHHRHHHSQHHHHYCWRHLHLCLCHWYCHCLSHCYHHHHHHTSATALHHCLQLNHHHHHHHPVLFKREKNFSETPLEISVL